MELTGSCHCQAVKFRVVSKAPYPYLVCYCSICRKTNGGTGAAINILAQADTFRILQGAEHLKIYQVGLRVALQVQKSVVQLHMNMGLQAELEQTVRSYLSKRTV